MFVTLNTFILDFFVSVLNAKVTMRKNRCNERGGYHGTCDFYLSVCHVMQLNYDCYPVSYTGTMELQTPPRHSGSYSAKFVNFTCASDNVRLHSVVTEINLCVLL